MADRTLAELTAKVRRAIRDEDSAWFTTDVEIAELYNRAAKKVYQHLKGAESFLILQSEEITLADGDADYTPTNAFQEPLWELCFLKVDDVVYNVPMEEFTEFDAPAFGTDEAQPYGFYVKDGDVYPLPIPDEDDKYVLLFRSWVPETFVTETAEGISGATVKYSAIWFDVLWRLTALEALIEMKRDTAQIAAMLDQEWKQAEAATLRFGCIQRTAESGMFDVEGC